MLFYLAAYTFTTLGTFGVVAWVGRRGDERLFVDDWAGLATARPALALAMTVFLLSLGGVPPTGGFFGKFYLFRSAMERSELYPLVIAGVLNSVVSMYYYLRVVVAMYFREPVRAAHSESLRRPHHARGPGGQRHRRRGAGHHAVDRRGVGRRRGDGGGQGRGDRSLAVARVRTGLARAASPPIAAGDLE